jgi:uncharacterized protein
MDLKETEAGIIIKVRVTPNSSRNAIVTDAAEVVGVKLTSPPVEGKANKHLVKFLAKRLKIAPSSITILKGLGSRDKTLLITGIDQGAVRAGLE